MLFWKNIEGLNASVCQTSTMTDCTRYHSLSCAFMRCSRCGDDVVQALTGILRW